MIAGDAVFERMLAEIHVDDSLAAALTMRANGDFDIALSNDPARS